MNTKQFSSINTQANIYLLKDTHNLLRSRSQHFDDQISQKNPHTFGHFCQDSQDMFDQIKSQVLWQNQPIKIESGESTSLQISTELPAKKRNDSRHFQIHHGHIRYMIRKRCYFPLSRCYQKTKQSKKSYFASLKTFFKQFKNKGTMKRYDQSMQEEFINICKDTTLSKDKKNQKDQTYEALKYLNENRHIYENAKLLDQFKAFIQKKQEPFKNLMSFNEFKLDSLVF